ncbi:hypothetical protein H0A73_00010 [Alcaligenaceae bacterium]|nr:hypothetical protein [Alcaligenaceae bacterium]
MFALFELDAGFVDDLLDADGVFLDLPVEIDRGPPPATAPWSASTFATSGI